MASEEVEANKAVLHSAMTTFFSPAAVVRPRRAGRRVSIWRQIEAGGGRNRGERENTKSWEEARALSKTCYTHTVLLAGQCWVLCDHILVAPCTKQNFKK